VSLCHIPSIPLSSLVLGPARQGGLSSLQEMLRGTAGRRRVRMEDHGRPPASCKEARQGTSGRGKTARARQSRLIPHGACNIKHFSRNRTNSPTDSERRTGIPGQVGE
jgi:hypothetical protein